MAASRKLQGEIDRCLKKVTEGVETFDDIWTKVLHAANANQKEKHEADLKKEIKKLQRLRDQIKTWQTSAEVKDKSSLVEHRKLIETQMERFKGLERETKTKAYSKEGLGAAAKLDPAQKERKECNSWLTANIEELNVQSDQFEAELDSLAVKKKKDRDKSGRLDSLKHWIERHQFHIKKLETLMRMLDNNAVDVETVNKIREDVEYYSKSNQEPDFEENEYMYCDINMENIEEVGMSDTVRCAGDDQSETTNSLHSANSPSPLSVHPSGSAFSSCGSSSSHHQSVPAGGLHDPAPEDNKRSRRRSISEDTPSQKASKHSSKHASVSSLSNLSTISSTATTTTSSSSTVVSTSTSSYSAHTPLVKQTSRSSTANSTASDTTHSDTPYLSPVGTGSAPNFAAVAAATTHTVSSLSQTQQQQQQQQLQQLQQHHQQQLVNSVCSQSAQSSQSCPAASTATTTTTTAASTVSATATLSASAGAGAVTTLASAAGVAATVDRVASPTDSTPAILPDVVMATTTTAAADITSPTQQQQQQQQQQQPQPHINGGDQCLDSLSAGKAGLCHNSTGSVDLQQQQQQQRGPLSVSPVPSSKPATTSECHIPLLYSVAPLGPVPITKEHEYQFQMLQAAFYHMPHPSDSERLRNYLPRNPYPTPSYLPQVPPAGSDSLEFFMKLSVETLFFIFYYMEGTKAQYLAAKSLKKQAWRFHTKYMMWFQRHEEPKLITDEFEQGTYIYFDFEKWTQRKKDGFKFEYKFLEDRDLT